jgi:peptidoglycan/xylan/chitin deacetylase (PgdA/CDA1 family)
MLQILKHPPSENEREALARLSFERYDVKTVAAKIQRRYERAFARAHSSDSIPVLMYHRVLENPPADSSHGIWVSARQFAYQLASLKRRGFETMTFRDYDRFVRGEARLPRRPIILTFDDGYVDNYTMAFPLLRNFGFRAVIFAVADKDRRTNIWDRDEQSAPLMSVSQLQELHRSGIEIGSHTVTHPRLPVTSAEEAHREVRDSKDSLEQLLGSSVLSFAYPYGALSETVKNLVDEAGYKYAVAADSGPINFYEDFLEIRRTQVFPWTSNIGFWKKTLPIYNRYKSIKS